MYDAKAFKRLIKKKGVDYAISYLSEHLGDISKEDYTKEYLLVNGYPNISFIYSLA